MAVYQGVQRGDLGDLRVFNGQGEIVPHALLRREARELTQVEESAVPFFPIASALGKAGGDADIAVEVRKSGDGTLVSVRQAHGVTGKDQVIRGAVVDVSKLKEGVRSLRLSIGPTELPFHAYSIETSDDLQQWRMLKSDAQLVRMEHDGRRIERSDAQWNADAGKYLRVLWADPLHAPSITGVAAGVQRIVPDQPARIWSAPIAPAVAQADVYDYALPGRMPLESVRINLPQINTLAPLTLQHYVNGYRHHQEQAEWEILTQAVAYRLQSPQGEIVSPDIELHDAPESRLRVAVDARSGGLGKTPPTLQVGFVPHTLVFLARGAGPYTLAWGAAAVDNAGLDIATLMPGYRADQKLGATSASLQLGGGAQAVKPAPASAPQTSKGVLWAVLITGVLVLAGMAAALIKQMKPPK
jgi:hypothetical protein